MANVHAIVTSKNLPRLMIHQKTSIVFGGKIAPFLAVMTSCGLTSQFAVGVTPFLPYSLYYPKGGS